MTLKDLLRKARTKTLDLTNKFAESELGQEINASGAIDKVKTASEKVKTVSSETITKVKKVADTAKKQVYKGVGTLEKQYNQKQSVGGGIRKTIDRGRLLCRGLKFAAKPLGSEKVTAKTREYYEKLYDYNHTFIETFTTKDKYDPDKLSDALKHKTAIVEIWGKRAVDKLGELAQKAGSAVHEDYREWIPTLDELIENYAGIGVKCKGLMLKPDLEACLNFHNQVFKIQNLPRDNLTLSIMEDIKVNAITSKDNLLKFYMIEGNAEENQNKAKVVIEYL